MSAALPITKLSIPIAFLVLARIKLRLRLLKENPAAKRTTLPLTASRTRSRMPWPS